MDDLVKQLRECSSDEAMWSRQAADRIEQLEDRANAATAAAYEVAARAAHEEAWPEDGTYGPEEREIEDAERATVTVIKATIRALATPDQTVALDKLIAEAVDAALKQAAFWVEEAMVIVAPDGVPQRMALDSYRKQFSTLVLASKKGGV